MKFEDIENKTVGWVECFLNDHSVFDGTGIRKAWDWMIVEIRQLRKIVEENQNNNQQLKAEICSTCGYFPCVNRKQFDGTVITHCTKYYKLSAFSCCVQ